MNDPVKAIDDFIMAVWAFIDRQIEIFAPVRELHSWIRFEDLWEGYLPTW
jgi:hypothetical protein